MLSHNQWMTKIQTALTASPGNMLKSTDKFCVECARRLFFCQGLVAQIARTDFGLIVQIGFCLLGCAVGSRGGQGIRILFLGFLLTLLQCVFPSQCTDRNSDLLRNVKRYPFPLLLKKLGALARWHYPTNIQVFRQTNDHATVSSAILLPLNLGTNCWALVHRSRGYLPNVNKRIGVNAAVF
ncbi:hypothetical protein BTO32_15230 [Marinobacter lutaoensis]|uniref:Uncharacterized protein n=1 Tax=Marinobacter lutaoensis TaxID=135739 RepID=A0A1V2DPF7_9GAMM|nr:hypothetical protein BTO32_15230 [Marinobacter lutaoensis]